MPVDWSQLAPAPYVAEPSLSAASAQLAFPALAPTSLNAPDLVEITSPGDAANGRGFYERFPVSGTYVWVFAFPMSGVDPSTYMSSIASECNTCSLVSLTNGTPGLFLGQSGAPNSVMWFNGGVQWDVMGPPAVLSEADALKFAGEVSAQQLPASSS